MRAIVFITFLIAIEIKPDGSIYMWEGYELQRGGVELVQPIAVFPSSDEGAKLRNSQLSGEYQIPGLTCQGWASGSVAKNICHARVRF